MASPPGPLSNREGVTSPLAYFDNGCQELIPLWLILIMNNKDFGLFNLLYNNQYQEGSHPFSVREGAGG